MRGRIRDQAWSALPATQGARIHFTQDTAGGDPNRRRALAGSGGGDRSRHHLGLTAMLLLTPAPGSTARSIRGAETAPSPLLGRLSAFRSTTAGAGWAVVGGGVHWPALGVPVSSFEEWVRKKKRPRRMALRHQIAKGGEPCLIVRGRKTHSA